MKLGLLPYLAAVTTACTFAACGGSTTSSNAAPTNDAGSTTDEGGANGDDGGTPDAMDEAPPAVDHGMPSTTYPAFKADMPQLNKNAGNILTAPIIVPITWETDSNAARIDSFADQIGGTTYWKKIVSEYGVGVATVGQHVHIPVNAQNPLPATMSTDELESMVDQSVGTTGWPAATAQTIFIVFPHPSIAVTAGGSPACTVFGGYHTVTQQGGHIYALALPCTGGAGALTNATVSGSHELAEAATDPFPGSGYSNFDSNHISWSFFNRFQPENGDDCEFYSDSSYKEMAPFDFEVQRSWSNVAAAGGHNPCVPATTGAYFGVTPTELETVAYAGRSGNIMTKGINIPVGTSKTFPVGFFSDGPMSGPWSIRVAEGFTPGVGGPPANHLSVSVDKTSGQNGEISYVTVTVNKAGSTISNRSFAKANYITLLSSLGNATHFMPVLITNN